MIHYVKVKKKDELLASLVNNDGMERDDRHDGVTEIMLTLEQHYGVHVFDDPHGRTYFRFRIAGQWTEPLFVRDFINGMFPYVQDIIRHL